MSDANEIRLSVAVCMDLEVLGSISLLPAINMSFTDENII